MDGILQKIQELLGGQSFMNIGAPQEPNEAPKQDAYAPVRDEGLNRLRTQFGQQDAPNWQAAAGMDANNISGLVRRNPVDDQETINRLLEMLQRPRK